MQTEAVDSDKCCVTLMITMGHVRCICDLYMVWAEFVLKCGLEGKGGRKKGREGGREGERERESSTVTLHIFSPDEWWYDSRLGCEGGSGYQREWLRGADSRGSKESLGCDRQVFALFVQ